MMVWIPALGPVQSSLSGVAHSYKTLANATGRETYLSIRWTPAVVKFQISLEKKSRPLIPLSLKNF